MAELKITTSL